MISIKKSLEQAGLQAMCQTALECYASAIQSIEKNAVVLEKDLVRAHRQRLKEIRRAIGTADLNQATLQLTAASLEAELKSYGEEAGLLAKASQIHLKFSDQPI